MADKTAFPDASRTNTWLMEPDRFTLVDDPSHPLYDPRVHNPVSNELVESIMTYGVIEPVIVKKNGEEIEIVDGRQRVKATLEANRRYQADGMDTRIKVPFMQRKDDDNRLYGITIAANEIRTQDPPLVKAEKAQRALGYGKTEREVAIDFGVTLQELKRLIGLLNLCPEAKEALKDGSLSATAASKLTPLSRTEQKKRLEEVRQDGGKITVAKLEKAVKGEGATPTKRMRSRAKVAECLESNTREGEYGKGWVAALRWVLFLDEDVN